jgi:hypothetical protein
MIFAFVAGLPAFAPFSGRPVSSSSGYFGAALDRKI